MTNALTRYPSNSNPLQGNKFELNFTRCPSLQYFCQSLNFPGVSLSEIPRNTPFVDIYSPGEKIIYDILNITFIVDEELKSWLEIHDWIRAMTFPEKYEEYQRLNKLSPVSRDSIFPQFSDAIVTFLNSSQRPTYRMKFFECFPTSLSSIILDATSDPNTIITADASFRFSYYNVEKLF